MEDYRNAFLWQAKEYKGTDQELTGHFVHLGQDWADAPTDPQMPLAEFLENYYPIYLHGNIRSLEPNMDILKYRVIFVPLNPPDHNSYDVESVSIFDDKLNIIYRYNNRIDWSLFCDFVLNPISEAFAERGIAFDFDFNEMKKFWRDDQDMNCFSAIL